MVEWSRKNRKTNDDCLKEGFQLTRVKFDRDDDRDREALSMRNCSINILGGSELELADPKKIILYF